MSNILEKISAALSPPKQPVNTLERLAREFEATTGQSNVTSEDISTLKAASEKYRRAWVARNQTFTEDAGRKHYRAHLDDHASRVGDDDFASERTRSIESVLTEFRAKQAAAAISMTRINQSVAAIVTSALKNFCSSGDTWILQREAGEKSEARIFGIAHVPSQLLVAAKHAVFQMKHRQQSGSNYASPSESVPFLNLTN